MNISKNIEICPVKGTILVDEISEEKFRKIIYNSDKEMSEEDKELKKSGLVKVSDKSNIIAPEGFGRSESDPDLMIKFAYGIVSVLPNTHNDSEIGVTLEKGDYVVYNHGSVIEYNATQDIKRKIVRCSEIIVVFKKKNK